MALTLTYLDDLSRVRIAATGLTADRVRVERSVDGGPWEPVRGGVSAAPAAGAIQLDDYEFGSDVENDYRVVPIDPPGGLLLTGASGDYASTPGTAALDITGDIDIRAYLTVSSWQAESFRVIAAKWGSDLSSSWIFYIAPDGALGFDWDPDGTGLNDKFAETSVPLSDLSTAVRVTLDVDNEGDYAVTFYTASSMSGPWQEVETVHGSGVTQINASSAALEVGSRNGGTSQLLDGVVHALQVRDGIDGTPVVDVNFGAQDNGATQFVDDAGLTWTVHGDARINGVEAASITPSLDGRVWLKHIRYPLLNRPVTVQNWSSRSRASRDVATPVAGRSLPVATSDVRLAPEFTLTLITGDLYDPEHDGEAEAAQLDAILAVGGVWFIHVPAGLPIPGGYVIIGATSVGRVVDAGRPPYRVELPCQVVAPPSPLVVGTTLTWETLRRLYGSWTALRADHQTWQALRDVIGDPIDLEVP